MDFNQTVVIGGAKWEPSFDDEVQQSPIETKGGQQMNVLGKPSTFMCNFASAWLIFCTFIFSYFEFHQLMHTTIILH